MQWFFLFTKMVRKADWAHPEGWMIAFQWGSQFHCGLRTRTPGTPHNVANGRTTAHPLRAEVLAEWGQPKHGPIRWSALLRWSAFHECAELNTRFSKARANETTHLWKFIDFLDLQARCRNECFKYNNKIIL